ncbi:DNA repair helicase XPB [candidate division CSSED10-310 bacterium]|uniref:DNA 3'-5' helicase n=1 Tax=candidate division CSSED10-310 bacterium TaxID=2855610 RepID=A0ABV6Z0G4_UNCC1
MGAESQKPLIIQSDQTILVEVNNPLYFEVRDRLLTFAELEKSPEFIHTYRITPISLWNAASAKINSDQIVNFLHHYSRYPVPQNIEYLIKDQMSRYGKLQLTQHKLKFDFLVLSSDDALLIEEIWNIRAIQPFLTQRIDEQQLLIQKFHRGRLKQALAKVGYPVEDLAGYIDGDPLRIVLREMSLAGKPFSLRNYQQESMDIFYAGGTERGGSGTIVLPCGAGKTMVGMGIMSLLNSHTLIIVTNITAVHQWRQELLDKTDLTDALIGEYTGERKVILPVTITTYQMITHRRRKEDDFRHFKIFTSHNWGLIIYDEVHLLPAPVFRVTSEIQARRRLGLTATLVREDGHESDVFSLIGPKKYDIPWKDLERRGWIAKAECIEIRCDLPEELRYEYATLPLRRKYRLAAENPEKFKAVQVLLKKHKNDQILIIGHYIQQLRKIAQMVKAPLITGQVTNAERDTLYDQFRRSLIPILVVSKVANFAIDLPDANVAIQISGTFGSRQEEAQRLGRILRPKENGKPATFYSVVTKNSRDQDFSTHRQLFLTEQGYKYIIHAFDGQTMDISYL